MAKEKFIDITCNEDGTVEIETTGYKGKSCETDISGLMKAVGQVVTTKKKQEYYQEEEKVRIHGKIGGV